MRLETAANLRPATSRIYNFFSVMAAKRFQVRSKEEMEQLIRDKSSKFTNKATQNVVKTLKEFCKEQNLQQSFEELNKTDVNSLLTYEICSIFELGGITKHLRANVAKNQTFSKYCGNRSKINSAHILMLGRP